MFANRLKLLRETHNLERKDLATILKITYPALSKYETDIRQPDYEILIRIANYFNVSIDYLLGRTDSINSGNMSLVQYQHNLSDDEMKILTLYNKLDERHKGMAEARMMQTLSEYEQSLSKKEISANKGVS